MTLLSRSAGIVDSVRLTGMVLPVLSTWPFWPGVHSRKYSPISDCGRDWQKASVRKDPKPAWVTFTVTRASMGCWQCEFLTAQHRSILAIEPARTPATL